MRKYPLKKKKKENHRAPDLEQQHANSGLTDGKKNPFLGDEREIPELAEHAVLVFAKCENIGERRHADKRQKPGLGCRSESSNKDFTMKGLVHASFLSLTVLFG